VRRLRIATFNLENLDDRLQDGLDFADRVAVLRPQFQRLRADVLCLQEVNAHTIFGKHGPREASALDKVIAGTDYEYRHRVITMNRGGQRPADHHNLVVLTRLPVVSSRQVWHDLVPPPNYHPVTAEPRAPAPQPVEWDRPVLHVVLQLPEGRRLHVVNVHLRAPRAAWLPGQKERHGCWQSVGGWAEGFFLAALKQAGQALEVRMLVDTLFDQDPEALIAVCGDFNAGDREVPVRTIRGDEEDTGNGHLAPRVLVVADRTVPETQRFSVIHHGRRIMLDHVVVSRPLLGWYMGAEVHNEALGDELVSPATIYATPESYHAPVVAEFALPHRG
jgi:endonuclease/exonuclease/phosphatase family metal-dependent hydrolase